jgi:hypothetical protein
VTDQLASPRHPASRVPEITGVRLTPSGGDATLVNLSSSGVLVECGTKVVPKSPVTVSFRGTFTPAFVDGHVVRCSVARIDKDSALRYHVGIAFNQTIPFDPGQADDQPAAPAATPCPLPGARRGAPPEVRNRW